MSAHREPAESASDRRLASIHDDLGHVRDNLSTTIDALIGRGERLERLVERSGELARDASDFHDAATPPMTLALRNAWRALAFLARLATCNYVCYDVYDVVVGETRHYGHVRRDVREMRRDG